MLRRLLEIAQPSIGHGKWIVDDRRPGVQPQRRLKVLDSAGIVLLRCRHTALLVPHHLAIWTQHADTVQKRLSCLRLPQIEISGNQPDQDWEIIWLNTMSLLEIPGRAGEVPLLLRQISEVVQPAKLIWGQLRCIS